MMTEIKFTPDDWDYGPTVSQIPDGKWVVHVPSDMGDIDASDARELAECLSKAADECDRRNGVK